MAEGTRMKTMEENLKRLEAIVQQNQEINERWVNSMQQSLNKTHQFLEENRVRMESLQQNTDQRVEGLATGLENFQRNTENFQKITEQRFESLTSMVRNLSRERDQDPPATDKDSHPVETGVNSVPGNVSVNVNLPNRICMESIQKITEQRFEAPIDVVGNLTSDLDQDRSEAMGGVNLGAQSSAFEVEDLVQEADDDHTTEQLNKERVYSDASSPRERQGKSQVAPINSGGNFGGNPNFGANLGANLNHGSTNAENLGPGKAPLQASGSTIEEDPKDLEVIFHPLMAFECGPRDVSRVVDISIASSETRVAYQMFEGMPRRKSELSKSWVVITEQWVAIMYSIDSVGFPYAHKVLEKMPRNDVALVGSSFHYSLRSIDSPSRFVFDPGTINGFPLHNGRMEAFIIVVFNPGIACTVEVEATVSVAIWWWLLHFWGFSRGIC